MSVNYDVFGFDSFDAIWMSGSLPWEGLEELCGMESVQFETGQGRRLLSVARGGILETHGVTCS